MIRRILAGVLGLFLVWIAAVYVQDMYYILTDKKNVVTIPSAQASGAHFKPENRGRLLPPNVKTCTVDKSQVLKDNYDRPVWKVTLRGTFSYDGKQVWAEDGQCVQEIYHSDWKCTSYETSFSENVVTAQVRLEKKCIGITDEIRFCELKVSCDQYGNIS